MVKLRGSLPAEAENNGLAPMGMELVDDTRVTVFAVIQLEVVKVVRDLDKGVAYPTVAVTRIEACRDEESTQSVVRLLDSLSGARLQRAPSLFPPGAYASTALDDDAIADWLTGDADEAGS